MLVVETIAKIRRAYFSQKKPIKEICRELRVSRKAVRKVIRSDATEFRYERETQPLPEVGPWREQLEALLSENDAKPSRERLTLVRLYEELRALGYDGSYDAVRRYAKSWRKERGAAQAQAYVPLSFAPGEAYQFDWSHEVVLLNGVTTTVKVAHMRLCHSRMLFVRAYPRETQEMVFDAHDRAFAFFKGACARGIYDNMKTAVETIFVGKDRQYNRRFLQMCGHYLVEPVACTPQSSLRRLRKLVCDGDRQMVKILAAVLDDGLPAVEAACAEAIDQGVHSADVILNILARRRDPGPPLTILTPDALKLRHAPLADCARYDQLRSSG